MGTGDVGRLPAELSACAWRARCSSGGLSMREAQGLAGRALLEALNVAFKVVAAGGGYAELGKLIAEIEAAR